VPPSPTPQKQKQKKAKRNGEKRTGKKTKTGCDIRRYVQHEECPAQTSCCFNAHVPSGCSSKEEKREKVKKVEKHVEVHSIPSNLYQILIPSLSPEFKKLLEHIDVILSNLIS